MFADQLNIQKTHLGMTNMTQAVLVLHFSAGVSFQEVGLGPSNQEEVLFLGVLSYPLASFLVEASLGAFHDPSYQGAPFQVGAYLVGVHDLAYQVGHLFLGLNQADLLDHQACLLEGAWVDLEVGHQHLRLALVRQVASGVVHQPHDLAVES